MPFRFVPRGFRICSFFAVLICLAGVEAADVPQGPSKDIPELQILNCYAGTWEVIAANQNAPNTPILKGKATSKWVLDGRFLEQTAALQAPDGSNSIKVTTLLTYDVEKKTYRSWNFVSNGHATESVGKWDAATQTMTSVSIPNAKGHIMTTTGNFDEAGIEKWKMSVVDQSGKIVRQIVGKNSRQRE
ncbi:MAG: Planctomycetes uncharacterized domain protein [Planctomycetaceae bacterium]|nr:Planctomycetes uncharacterized domain protein [Planctomycetaceae bacterium]